MPRTLLRQSPDRARSGLGAAAELSGLAEAEHPGVGVVAEGSAVCGVPAVVIPVGVGRQHRPVGRNTGAVLERHRRPAAAAEPDPGPTEGLVMLA